MQRTVKDYFIILLKGMAMGAADVVPGVSGGTIAFISGIYQELVESISNINLALFKTIKTDGFKAFWQKANANFLTALAFGIIISALSVMKVMHFLLENHPIKIWAFFFGLVLASILFVAKQITKWNAITIILLIVSAIGAFGITKLSTMQGIDSTAFLVLAGAIASCAMILPGISGAFILVLLGAYATISESVHNHDLKKVGAVALGAIIGLLSFSRLLKWLFNNYKNATLAILTGFILGSLNKIWPWKKVLESVVIGDKTHILKDDSVLPGNYAGDPQILYAIGLSILGFISILALEKLGERNK
ncbi:DUF368 domain-containing protein [Aquimarina agarilytica]|uniref:DUF368 domain-containing protein n=1 Tax=Aquimarina agarilytica TaxID=1087449 RepID=UPI0002892759|nr:DUF368 domain-containing protein [Aquimarina agarilytica]